MAKRPSNTSNPLVIPQPKTLSGIDALLEHQGINAKRHELIEAQNIFDKSTHAAHSKAVDALGKTSSGSIGIKLDSLKDTEEKLAEAKDGPLKDFHAKQKEDKLKDLKKEGGEHLKSHGKALEQMEEAKKAITKDVNEATKKLKKQYEVDVQRLKSIKVKDAAHGEQIQAELEAMAKAHEKNLTAVAHAGEKMTQELTTKLEKATEVVASIEGKTGLKLNDHVNKNTLSAISSSAKSGEKGMMSSIKNNWGKSGTAMKAARVGGAALGGILVADGAKNMARGIGVFSPKTDEAGKEIPAGPGDIIKGLGEAGLGAGALYVALVHGGKGKSLV